MAYVEKFLIPAALALVTWFLGPTVKLNGIQRVSAVIAVAAFTLFVTETFSLRGQAQQQVTNSQSDAPAPQPAPPPNTRQSGNATTQGDASPAVTGDGNTYNYTDKPSRKGKH